MGWNGSGDIGRARTPTAPQKKAPSKLRGIIAGALAAAVVFAGVFYFLSGDKAPAAGQKDKSARRIKSVDVVASTNRLLKAAKRRTVAKTGDKVADAVAELQAADELLEINRPVQSKTKPIKPLPYGSGVEQIMVWVFSRQLGDVPPPLPSISPQELSQMEEILTSKMRINDDDDEKTREVKEYIACAKKEMAKFIGEGGTPDEYLRYYVEQQCLAYDEFMEAQRNYQNLYDEDPELAKQFATKANELLAKRGIKPIEEVSEEDEAQGENPEEGN